MDYQVDHLHAVGLHWHRRTSFGCHGVKLVTAVIEAYMRLHLEVFPF
jgi:hypothetical protein